MAVYLSNEMLCHIFSYLEDDTASLTAAALTSRQWFDCGIQSLWKEENGNRLVRIDPSRRDLYGRCIRKLQLDGYLCQGGDSKTRAQASARFRALDAKLSERGRLNAQWVTFLNDYNWSSLREISFSKVYVDQALLEHLGNTCRGLRSLRLFHAINFQPADFLRLLEQLPSLTAIHFCEGTRNLITSEVFAYLANRRIIQVLTMKEPLQRAIMENEAATSKSFQDLRSANLNLVIGSMDRFVTVMPGITSLSLELWWTDTKMFKTLSRLERLQTLSITIAYKLEMPPEHILPICNIKSLKKLCVQGKSENLRAFKFRDSDFDSLVSQLNDLEELSFLVACDMSFASLKSLSRHCRFLRHLRLLPSNWDFDALFSNASEEPLFPHLESVNTVPEWNTMPFVDDVSRSIIAREKAMLFRFHMPNLNTMTATVHGEFEKEVLEIWTELKRNAVNP
ncbi:hypothetical protein ASPZODRAFT_22967 [Penicilliopsis zonata CBS 506.65]|uniref:F-box domain-containing protein n=1 Tax=Penicilliopsis zonata CBS 506.65 TaxID=1073090 RepID=A0A1L9SSY6_9EURO|nr:hypothetical protein ASPZODRAFT_22967 [Penicilliopsis zonata CBS 506.65]OJJ50309.1 hypothetical protein ASPZODRAFT_22967 [Penicilliopsis zonata CBS 506.65]